MPPQLVALTDGPSILLDKPILLFGRNPECDIQIDSRKISRRHCCIAQVNDYLVVRDLGSTNGIRINGVRVLEGKLRGGDELTIGSHRYQIRWDPLEDRGGRSGDRKPEPARRPVAPVSSDEDEMLESCDEPVPLIEAGAAPARPAPSPTVSPAAFDGTDGPSLREAPLVIPENLDLAPVSDSLPPGGATARPSPEPPLSS